MKTEFNRAEQKYKITVSKQMLNSPVVPKNIPSDVIFYLFWQSAELDDRLSYMNVVYTVTIASEFNVVMSVNSMRDVNARVIDLDSDPDLVINATCSSTWNDESGEQCDFSSGLSFRWDCAKTGIVNAELAKYCDEWTGSPILVIPNNKIQENGLVNQPIEITVKVSSIEASEQTGRAAEILQFGVDKSKSIFKWVNTRKPKFEIALP